MARLTEDVGTAAAALTAADTDRAAAATAVAEARDALMEARHADMARELRGRLTAGEACPVCDQPVHVVPRAPRAATVAAAERALAKAVRVEERSEAEQQRRAAGEAAARAASAAAAEGVTRAEGAAAKADAALREAEAAGKIFEREKQPTRAIESILFAADTAWNGRKVDEARRLVERGLEASAAARDTAHLPKLLSLAATVANLRGDYARAAAYGAQLADHGLPDLGAEQLLRPVGAGEVGQRLVGEGDAAEMRRQRLDLRDGQHAALEVVAHAFDAAGGGGAVHGGWMETDSGCGRFQNG